MSVCWDLSDLFSELESVQISLEEKKRKAQARKEKIFEHIESLSKYINEQLKRRSQEEGPITRSLQSYIDSQAILVKQVISIDEMIAKLSLGGGARRSAKKPAAPNKKKATAKPRK